MKTKHIQELFRQKQYDSFLSGETVTGGISLEKTKT